MTNSIYKPLFAFLILFLFSSFAKASFNICTLNSNLKIEFDYQLTSAFIHPPNVSAVINDNSDPSINYGVVMRVYDNNKLIDISNLSIKTISDNENVIKNKDLQVIDSANFLTLKIKSFAGVGYANIKISTTYKKSETSVDLFYAVSKSANNYKNYWHTGISDASASIPIDSELMLVADDEKNQICLYNRFKSGLPISVFNYDKYLHLIDGEKDNFKEVDCESAVRSLTNENRIYWMGSMSNGGKYDKIERNRNWLFCTEINKIGKSINLSVTGEYNKLRESIVIWGDSYGYHFSEFAKSGKNPKLKDGFNIEGICFGPDSTTLFIGFRAPSIQVNEKQKAIIAPLLNFEKWFNLGNVKSEALFGKPILLNLDGRGIRDIIKLTNNNYIIIAGNSDESNNPAIYYWTGFEKDNPSLIAISDLNNIRPEAGMEINDNAHKKIYLQLLSDNGKEEYYQDGIRAKFLPGEYKKFSNTIVDISSYLTNETY